MKIVRSLVLAVFIVSPLTADVTLLQLDDAAVTQERDRIAADFKKRDYLTKTSYAILAAGSLWFAYKWGLFDKLLGKQSEASSITSLVVPENPTVLPTDINVLSHDQTLPLVKVLVDHAKYQSDVNKILVDHVQEQAKEIVKLKAKDVAAAEHWFISGAKYVGLTGFSMIAGFVVQSKWQKFINYAFAEPTFDWFYGSHSMLNRIDSLRYHIANAFDATGTVPQTVLDFHYDSIAPTLDVISKNLLELIAFSEYYFDRLDPVIVSQYNLDGASRYLFNSANDYFADLYNALQAKDRAKALALTDAFRAELANYNKDCQAFENAVLG